MFPTIFNYVKSLFGYETETNPYLNMDFNNNNKYTEKSSAVNRKNTVDLFNREFKDVKELIIHYYQNYPEQFYLGYPEFAVFKLKLDKSYLNGLPKLENRKREQVRNWMFNSKLTLQQFTEIGF